MLILNGLALCVSQHHPLLSFWFLFKLEAAFVGSRRFGKFDHLCWVVFDVLTLSVFHNGCCLCLISTSFLSFVLVNKGERLLAYLNLCYVFFLFEPKMVTIVFSQLLA